MSEEKLNVEETPKKKGVVAMIVSAVVIVLLVVLGIVFLMLMNLNTTIKVGGETLVSTLTKGETTIGDVDISLLSGHVMLKDIVIKNPKTNAQGEATNFATEDFVSLGLIQVDLSIASLMSDVIEIQEVIIKKPSITYEKTPLNDSNLHVILANIQSFAGAPKEEVAKEKAEEPESEEKGQGKKVTIDHLRIEGASANVSSCGITAPLLVPTIDMKDIGKDTGGAEIVTVLSDTFTKLFTAIFDGLKDLGVTVLELGKEAGKKLLEGGKEAGKTILDAGKNLIDGVRIPNPFKD